MADSKLKEIAKLVNSAIDASAVGVATVDIGIQLYVPMNLQFDRNQSAYTLASALADEVESHVDRFRAGDRPEAFNDLNLDYLSINGDQDALQKLPTPSQPIGFPTVVQFVPAFKALVRANAAENRLLINDDAPAAQKFVPASSDPDAAKNEWQTKMQKVVTTTIEQLGIKQPDSIEDWQDQLLDLLADAQLAWPEGEDDADPQMFTNLYKCPDCGHEWTDEWTATCDDDCPACGKRHISPTHSE